MYCKVLLTIFFFILFVPTQSISQPLVEWMRLYDNGQKETFYDVYRVAENGYIACGLTGNYRNPNNPSDQMWIVRVDDRGEILWNESYGQNNVNDNLYSIIEADNGDFVATGYFGASVAVLRVNSEGEVIWSNSYRAGDGYAVIELKDGNFVIAGIYHRDAFLLCIDGEGDELWERTFHRDDRWHELYTLRETDNGVIAAGSIRAQNAIRSVWAIKASIEDEGETIWERNYSPSRYNVCRSMVSTAGGFVLAGWTIDNYQVQSSIDFLLLRINSRGELIWSQRYDWGRSDYEERSYGVTQLSDGGFLLAGYQKRGMEDREINPAVVRTYANGQMRWQRVYPFSEEEGFRRVGNSFQSVVLGQDNSIMVCGKLNLDESEYDGVLLKIERDVIGPLVFYWSPKDTMVSALVGDTVSFIVRARNQIGFEMDYQWMREGEEISTDTTVTVVFDNFGEDSLRCIITDDEASVSINWHIDVTSLYIDSHQPDSLNPSIRRNNSINFSVTTRAIEDDPVEYVWLLDDEQIAENDSVTIRFDRGREHSVTAIASQGELADSVIWQVMVNDLIVDYMPQQLELSVEVDTTFEFEVFPFNPNDDSLQFLWTLNGDSISDNSWVLVNFDSEGLYNITAYVSDTTESDSLTWTIDVTPNSVYSGEPQHPDTPTLYPPVPNPFNSVTTVRYYLPIVSKVRLNLFDVNGRLIAELVDGYRIRGQHSVGVDGSDLVSGLYLVRMESDYNIQIRKALLIK